MSFSSSPSTEPLPVTLLTGFLGGSKTAQSNQLIRAAWYARQSELNPAARQLLVVRGEMDFRQLVVQPSLQHVPYRAKLGSLPSGDHRSRFVFIVRDREAEFVAKVLADFTRQARPACPSAPQRTAVNP